MPSLHEISKESLLAKLCQDSFEQFVLQFWETVSPDPLIFSYHVEAIILHLQALGEGRIKRLCILAPLRLGKSIFCSVLFPAWLHCRNPLLRILTATYKLDLTKRDCAETKKILDSKLYQSLFGTQFQDDTSKETESYYKNSQGGFRKALSVQAGSTGENGDIIIGDDQHNIATITSEAERAREANYFFNVLSNRIVPGTNKDRVLVAGCRLHEDDLYARLISDYKDYTFLVLPMEADPERTNNQVEYPNALGWTDSRSPGELLCPERASLAYVNEKKKNLRANYAYQFQQEGTTKEGNLFRTDWFKFYTQDEFSFKLPNRTINKSEASYFLTTDLAFGLNKENDFTVIATWAMLKGYLLLIDLVRKRLDGTQLIPTTKAVYQSYKASFATVEDVQAQRIMVDQLRQEGIFVKALSRQGDKDLRSMTAQILAEAGRVLLPSGKSFVADFLKEIAAFPRGRFDDQVDCLSDACLVSNRHNRVITPDDEPISERGAILQDSHNYETNFTMDQLLNTLRKLDERSQKRIAGLCGSTIKLRCENQAQYKEWVQAFQNAIAT